MKYTVSGSTLQYKVGLTLSFLSLISRGVGGIQKGNTSIIQRPEFSLSTSTLQYGHSRAVVYSTVYTVYTAASGKPSEDGGVKQDTTALECGVTAVSYRVLVLLCRQALFTDCWNKFFGGVRELPVLPVDRDPRRALQTSWSGWL